MRLPQGCGDLSGKVIRMNRSLYGMRLSQGCGDLSGEVIRMNHSLYDLKHVLRS